MLYVPSVSNMTVQALQPGGTRSDMTYIGGAGGGGEPQGGRAGGPGGAEPAGGRAAGPGPCWPHQCGSGGGPVAVRVRRRQPAVQVADARVEDVAALPRPLPDFSRRLNLVAALLLRLAPSEPRSWGLGPQGRSSNRHTDASPYNMNAGAIAWRVANGRRTTGSEPPCAEGRDDSENRSGR